MNQLIRLLACATQGGGGNDDARLRDLLLPFNTRFIHLDRSKKFAAGYEILRCLRSHQFSLFVMEGSGVAVGISAIVAKLLFGARYIVSSGDAIAPFLSARHAFGAPIFKLYERLLYANCSGFIGWTPYLVGRALTLGATRGITVPGWAPYTMAPSTLADARRAIRSRFGIPPEAVVYGIVGSLNWSGRFNYCYGSELVRAAVRKASRAYVIVVGDGSGLQHLQKIAGSALNKTIFLTGRVEREEVPAYMAAMDVGCIPQSVDGVGNFRYTTKISEYQAFGLPFITTQIPMSYDLDHGNLWRLPGKYPWGEPFLEALANLMVTLTHDDIGRRKASHPDPSQTFDRETQMQRMTAFLQDVLDERTKATS